MLGFGSIGEFSIGEFTQGSSSGTLTQAAGTGVAGALTPSVSASITGVFGTGLAQALTPSVSPGALTQAAGIGTAGQIGGSEAGFIVGASGTGVARGLTPEVDKPLGQASGTGQAGTFSFGTPGSGTLVGVSGTGVARSLLPSVATTINGAAAIGVAGIITVSIVNGVLPPGGGTSSVLKPPRRDKRIKTGLEPVTRAPKPEAPKLNPVPVPVPVAVKPKPKRLVPMATPIEIVDPHEPDSMLALQASVHDAEDIAAIHRYLDRIEIEEQDAQDVADILALLD